MSAQLLHKPVELKPGTWVLEDGRYWQNKGTESLHHQFRRNARFLVGDYLMREEDAQMLPQRVYLALHFAYAGDQNSWVVWRRIAARQALEYARSAVHECEERRSRCIQDTLREFDSGRRSPFWALDDLKKALTKWHMFPNTPFDPINNGSQKPSWAIDPGP